MCLWYKSSVCLRWGITNKCCWVPSKTFAFHTLSCLVSWLEPTSGREAQSLLLSHIENSVCFSFFFSSLNIWLPIRPNANSSVQQAGQQQNCQEKQEKLINFNKQAPPSGPLKMMCIFFLLTITCCISSRTIHHFGQTILIGLNPPMICCSWVKVGLILALSWKLTLGASDDTHQFRLSGKGFQDQIHFIILEARPPTLHFPPLSSSSHVCCCDLSLHSLQATWSWSLDAMEREMVLVTCSNHPDGVLLTYIHLGMLFKKARLFTSKKMNW